jgi:PKHD-type hydroxylase
MIFENNKKIFCEPIAERQFLSATECRQLVETFEQNVSKSIKSQINLSLETENSIRSSRSLFLKDYEFESIVSSVGRKVFDINNEFWNFQLSNRIENFQIIKYENPGDHYDWHMDWNSDPMCSTRKISIVIQLSDPTNYTGCDLVLRPGNAQHFGSRQQGAAIVFPSFLLHKVTPIESGIRYSLVFWIEGDSYR